MTKPVTATAAMILLERGQIDLAQPVSDFLPGFADVKVEKNGELVSSATPVTLLHLLNMTSGITYGDEDTIAGQMTLDFMETCADKLYTKEAVSTVEFANGLGSLPVRGRVRLGWMAWLLFCKFPEGTDDYFADAAEEGFRNDCHDTKNTQCFVKRSMKTA